MKKDKTRYICNDCGQEEVKWSGRCSSCLSWNSFSEKLVSSSDVLGRRRKSSTASSAPDSRDTAPMPLSAFVIPTGQDEVTDSGMAEINRVLGGGITAGSAILVGGEPGIGKSTIMMQIAHNLSVSRKVIYIAGEESPSQIKQRAKRLGITEDKNLVFLFTTELSEVTAVLDKTKPDAIIVDSIQTLFTPEAGSVSGTISQLKICCQELIDIVKISGAALFLVAHVTKEGVIAGPKTIEHMVDTVLYFEHSENEMRILRAVKNRFGATDELGLFHMSPSGLVQITSPESAFLILRAGENPPGICAAAIHEGSRVFLVEVQALTVPAKGGISRIFSDRINSSRVSRIAAVLEKHTELRFSDQDIYINVAGGMKIKETGVDLAAALALFSARTGIPLPAKTAAAGELSLTGELRQIPFMPKRLKSATACGIKNFYGPPSATVTETPTSTAKSEILTSAENINSLIKLLFTHKGGK